MNRDLYSTDDQLFTVFAFKYVHTFNKYPCTLNNNYGKISFCLANRLQTAFLTVYRIVQNPNNGHKSYKMGNLSAVC